MGSTGDDSPHRASEPEPAAAEIEAKFLVEDASQLAQLIEMLRSQDVASARAVDVVDCYRDTPDWRLFRAGWAYRWRDASGNKKLTLKSVEMGDGVVHRRRELEQAVSAFPEGGVVIWTGPVAEELNGLGSGDPRELFRVHNYRRLFDVRAAGGALIEIAIDQATITGETASKSAPGRMEFVEVEMELKEGPPEALRQLADAVQQKLHLLPSRLSKFQRGLQTAGLSPPGPPGRRAFEETTFIQELRRLPPLPADPAVHLAYRCLLEQFERMLAEEPKAWEGLDPEGVHQMRVATRRTRAAFRAFKSILPARAIGSFNREFKWVAGVLGEVRDLDVYRANLKEYTAEIPPADAAELGDYQKYLADRWRSARKRLLRCLTSRRYERLKDRLGLFLQRGPSRAVVKAAGGLTVGGAARRLIPKRYKRVRRDGRAVSPGSPDQDLHALRIQCKRLRYLFEFFHSIYGKALKGYIKRLKKLQDVLGDFNDACVATEQLREYAERVPARARSRGQLIALGELISGQRRLAAQRRKDFAKVWKRFDRKGGRKALLATLGGGEAMPGETTSPRGRRNNERQSNSPAKSDSPGVRRAVPPAKRRTRVLPDNVAEEAALDPPQGDH